MVSSQFGSGLANTDIIFPSREHRLRLRIAIRGVGWCVGCCSAQHSDHFTLASIWLLLSLSPHSILGARTAPISLTNLQPKQRILCIKQEKKQKTQNRLFCYYCYGVKLLKHIFLLLFPLSSVRLTVPPQGHNAGLQASATMNHRVCFVMVPRWQACIPLHSHKTYRYNAGRGCGGEEAR